MIDRLPRITSVAPVIYGVVKLVFDDGYEGVVDLRPVMAKGSMFRHLRDDPKSFEKVAVSEYGHSIYWTDESGAEVDFGADRLREKAERQAELLRQAAS
jgi:hypothetical protein